MVLRGTRIGEPYQSALDFCHSPIWNIEFVCFKFTFWRSKTLYMRSFFRKFCLYEWLVFNRGLWWRRYGIYLECYVFPIIAKEEKKLWACLEKFWSGTPAITEARCPSLRSGNCPDSSMHFLALPISLRLCNSCLEYKNPSP